MEPVSTLTDEEILARYRKNYGLGDDITLDKVEQHVQLEKALTARLLNFSPETRWTVFSDAYTELYEKLPWLNTNTKNTDDIDGTIIRWKYLLPTPLRIFEIGSGKARLLKYLTSQGHQCVATEITKERGVKHLPSATGLEWHVTDGVNLRNFEPENHYDIVISTQVVEHFHPDDLVTHFRNARDILVNGGRYIFDTPHVSCGPFDLSRVFALDRAVFMHLKEYNYLDLGALLKEAGFRSVRAVFAIKIGRGNSKWAVRESLWYYRYCCFWDRLEMTLRLKPRSRRLFRKLLRLFFVPSIIWISAQK